MNHEFGPVTPNTVYYFVITAETAEGLSPPSSAISFTTPDGELVAAQFAVVGREFDIKIIMPKVTLIRRIFIYKVFSIYSTTFCMPTS